MKITLDDIRAAQSRRARPGASEGEKHARAVALLEVLNRQKHGGGKFADSAATGAFGNLSDEAAGGRKGDRAEWRRQRDRILDSLESEIRALSPEQRKFEWGGAAYLGGDRVRSSGFIGGTRSDSNPRLSAFLHRHRKNILGYIHNHPSNSYISPADRSEAFKLSDASDRNPKLKGEPVVCFLYTELKGRTPC